MSIKTNTPRAGTKEDRTGPEAVQDNRQGTPQLNNNDKETIQIATLLTVIASYYIAVLVQEGFVRLVLEWNWTKQHINGRFLYCQCHQR